MQTKLTLRLDEALIDRAKAYSRESGKSLSRIVADYFAVLTHKEPPGKSPTPKAGLPPITRSLVGSLKDPDAEADVGVEDYRRYVEDKYQ